MLWAALLAVLASPCVAAAQPGTGDGAVREEAFIEALRREDPASADRFVALRDAQQKAIAELRSTESRANAVPPALQTDAPYARGRLVMTPIGNGRFTVEVTRGADKWASRA